MTLIRQRQSIGDLRHRVIIEQPVRERRPDGSYSESWETRVAAWARVEPLTGREFWAAAEVNSQVTHRVTMRYRPGLTTRNRLRFRERTLNIASVLNPDERNQVLQLMCEEVT